MATYLSAHQHHELLNATFMESRFANRIQIVGDPVQDPLESFNSMRQPQINTLEISVMFTAKNSYQTLTEHDLATLRSTINQDRRRAEPDAGILIDDRHFQEGVWICQDLESFIWLLGITWGQSVNSKQLKVSTVDNREEYIFFAEIAAENIGSNLLTYHIPKYNNDLDTAKWELIYKDRSFVIMRMDLLSAGLLMNTQFTLHYGDIEFPLAMLCDEV